MKEMTPVADPRRMMISISNEVNEVHKEMLKEKLKRSF
jgi:hypothetical protein